MSECVDYLQPLAVLLLVVLNWCLVLVCAGYHFHRGYLWYGGLTLGIFLMAGWITNWFNLFRHEHPRMKQRTTIKKAKVYVLHLFPSLPFIFWLCDWLGHPTSWMSNYWVWTLRVFQTTTGSLTQAFLQTYLIIHLWWTPDIPQHFYTVLMVTAVFMAADAVVGVVGFIWKEHFEEKHETLPIIDIFLIFISMTCNMGGRVVLMAVVAAANNWWLLAAALCTPILLNYVACYIIFVQSHTFSNSLAKKNITHCFFPLPIAILYSMTASQTKFTTVLTTLSWLGYSLPQIVKHHDTAFQWLIWCCPAGAQVIGLVILVVKWNIYKKAFFRFSRILMVIPNEANVKDSQDEKV